MRGSSFGDSKDDPRNASITPQDINHLPRVDTNVAAKAARATQSEVPMTLLQAIETYPKAIEWSVLISTCTMEVFDIVLINSTTWQSGLSNGALVGEVLGLLFIGYIVERIGYKKTMIGSLTLLTGLIFIIFFAQSLPMLLVGEIFMGIPWGAFQTLTTTYAAEAYPVSLRVYLTTYVNLCWVIAHFLSPAVLESVANKTGPIGYKLPYGIQWILPLPLLIGIALAPGSPWWLVRNNRPEEVKKQVLRLTSRNQTDSGFNADETDNMMVFTNELGKESTEGTNYWDCFKGTDLRRTEIVCVVCGIQNMYGASSFTGYSTYFFEQAGLDVSSAFSMSLGQYCLGAVDTLLSWVLMMEFGRRALYLWGQIAMASILLIV
ncbi:sugar porter family MFS transporter, partial [Aureobasidium melanogenum]